MDKTSLMPDNAASITKGFGEYLLAKNKRGWFHVKNNLQAKLNSDLFLLQLCQTPEIFISAIDLFFSKWEVNVEDYQLAVTGNLKKSVFRFGFR